MSNETTTPVKPTPIQFESLGITLNSPADLDRQAVEALEARLSPEYKQNADKIEQLARTFQSLAEGLPSDISLSQAYAKLQAAGGNIDASAEPWLRDFAAKVKSSRLPVVGGVVGAADNMNTLGNILGGVTNTAYDALAFLPRLATATGKQASDFWHSFDPTMSGNEAKAFAVLYASLQQEGMSAHDALPMMTMPFDGKDSKIESSPGAYLMAAIKSWGSKLLAVPVIREFMAANIAVLQFIAQYVTKQPHERESIGQIFSNSVAMLNENAATIGSVEELAHDSVRGDQRTAAAGKLRGFFGEQSLGGQLASTLERNGTARTSNGNVNIEDGAPQGTPQGTNHFAGITGAMGETLSTPGGVVGAGILTAVGLHQKERIVGAAVKVGTGVVDLVKGTGKLAVGTVVGAANMTASALGGTTAGLADGIGRTAGLGNTATKLGGNTAVGNAARVATNTVTDLVSGTAAKVTGTALAQAPAASAVASSTFRVTQFGGKLVGRVAAPLAIATSGWDLIKGVEAYQAGDTEEATRRGTSVGFTASFAGAGALAGAPFAGVGAAPGALIGAAVGGIADYFYGDSVADSIIGKDGATAQQVSEQQAAAALAEAGRDAEARAQTARDAAKLAAGQMQINKPVALMGAVGGDNLRPSDAPSAADTLRNLGLMPQRN